MPKKSPLTATFLIPLASAERRATALSGFVCVERPRRTQAWCAVVSHLDPTHSRRAPRSGHPHMSIGAWLLATACTAASAFAQTRYQVSQAVVTGTSLIESSDTGGATTVHASAHAITNDGWTLRGDSAARADYGILRASASVVGTGPITGNASFGGYAFSRASFDDTLLLMPADPDLVGTSGVMTASIMITGSLDASWAGNFWWFGEGQQPNASYSLDVGVQTFSGSISMTYGDMVFHPPQTIIENALPRLATFDLPFTFGQSSPLSVGFQVSAQVVPLGDSAEITAFGASILAFNSSVWQGISQVRTHGGEPLPSSAWTLSSASGTDYRHVVPTPASAGLLGLSLLCAARRRR